MAAVDHRESRLAWLGIGNVAGALVRAQDVPPRVETVFQFPGVVGYRLPTLHVPETSLGDGDLLLMATDGISPSFLDDVPASAAVESLANGILTAHARPEDDALVLVARYSVGPSEA